jgi:hypothetical protein
VSSYQFKIGAQTVPSTAPSKYPEMFAEVLKAMGSLSDLAYNPNIDFSSYTQSSNTALVIGSDANYNAQQSASWYIGIDLENYPNAPKDSIFAGMNTTTDDTYLMVTYGSTAPTHTAPRWDIFAVFDAVIVCENGVAFNRQ